MSKNFKVFLNPIEGQEKWLNEKSAEGLKLSGVGRFTYEFTKCEPNQYQYAVDYIGNKSNIERKEYESFLDDLKINYYEKPLNFGQFSIGRTKYRPYAGKGGRLAASKGMINREILILEKKNNGKTFNIYNNVKDKIIALKERKKPYIYLLTFMIAMELYVNFIKKPLINFSYINNRNIFGNNTSSILLGMVGIFCLMRIIQLSLSMKTLNEKKNIRE